MWTHGSNATFIATKKFELELKETMDDQLQELVKTFERRTGEKFDILDGNPSDKTQQKKDKMNTEFAKMILNAKSQFSVDFRSEVPGLFHTLENRFFYQY